MKAGTCSLRTAMRAHPQVAMPASETGFFSNWYGEGFGWYLEQFAGFADDALWGEKSANYSASFEAPERIKAYNPRAKVIFTLRHPVRRAISHYHHSRLRTAENAPTVEHDLDSKQYETNYFYSYVYRSQYEKHLRRYAEFFGKEETLVLVLEEVIREPEPWMRAVQDFLGIDRLPVAAWPHSNPTKSRLIDTYPVAPETVARLAEVLAPTTRHVEAYLGRSLPDWKV